MAHRRAAPQLAQDRDRLAQARATLVERHAAHLVLLGELAADADAEDQVAFGEVIECRDLFGDRRGMAQRQQVHRRAQDEPSAHHRRLGELQERIEDRDRKRNMVADPERVEAAAVDQLDEIAHFVDRRHPRRRRRLAAPMNGLHADLELRLER